MTRNDFDMNQLLELKLAVKKGLKDDLVAIIADPRLTYGKMHAAVEKMDNDIDPEKAKEFIRPGREEWQVRIAIAGLSYGLSPEQIRTFTKDGLGERQAAEVCHYLARNLISDEDAAILSERELTQNQARVAKEALTGRPPVPRDVVRRAISAGWDDYVISAVFAAVITGIPEDVAFSYAKNGYDGGQLRVIFEGLSDDRTKNRVWLYANPKYSAYRMRAVLYNIQSGMADEDVLYLLDLGLDNSQIECVAECVRTGRTDLIDLIKRFPGEKADIVWNAIGKGCQPSEIERFAKEELSAEQLREACRMIEDHLMPDDIHEFADPALSAEQMRILRARYRDNQEETRALAERMKAGETVKETYDAMLDGILAGIEETGE